MESSDKTTAVRILQQQHKTAGTAGDANNSRGARIGGDICSRRHINNSRDSDNNRDSENSSDAHNIRDTRVEFS
jgi:hypothetical protein